MWLQSDLLVLLSSNTTTRFGHLQVLSAWVFLSNFVFFWWTPGSWTRKLCFFLISRCHQSVRLEWVNLAFCSTATSNFPCLCSLPKTIHDTTCKAAVGAANDTATRRNDTTRPGSNLDRAMVLDPLIFWYLHMNSTGNAPPSKRNASRSRRWFNVMWVYHRVSSQLNSWKFLWLHSIWSMPTIGKALPRVTTWRALTPMRYHATWPPYDTEVGGATCGQESMWDHDSVVWTSTSCSRWAADRHQTKRRMRYLQFESGPNTSHILASKNPPAHGMLQPKFRGCSFHLSISCYHDVLYLIYLVYDGLCAYRM